MSIFFNIVILILGFALLIKGADFFVEGSSSIACRYHVPPIIIGLTIVAMGTSLPETAVSITAALEGNNEIAISNVVGSNIFNLIVVIGLCAVLAPLYVTKETLVRDIPVSIGAGGMLLLLGFLSFGNEASMVLGRADGFILLAIFAVYIFFMIKEALKARALACGNLQSSNADEVCPVDVDICLDNGEPLQFDGEEIHQMPVFKSLLYIIGGLAGIILGGKFTVNSASSLALAMGMSQTLVGLTIVAIGTSLPELVTSVVAARKNQVDMAIGNAVGSNIYNILMVLGISALLSPMAITHQTVVDVCVLLMLSALVCIFCATRRRISRPEGIIMLILYGIYSAYIFTR